MASNVTVVLTNYKRTANLFPIMRAFKAQSVEPDSFVLVDNHPPEESEFEAGRVLSRKFEDVYRFTVNAGPSCRFIGAVFAKTKYTLFYDDDMVPAKYMLESFINSASDLNDQFATLGGIARFVHEGAVRSRNVARSARRCRPVDVTCRAHFMLTEHVPYAIADRIRCQQDGMSGAVLRNDDVFLSLGVQLATGFSSYLSRKTGKADRINSKDLAAPFAVGFNKDHHSSRAELVRWYMRQGWDVIR